MLKMINDKIVMLENAIKELEAHKVRYIKLERELLAAGSDNQTIELLQRIAQIGALVSSYTLTNLKGE